MQIHSTNWNIHFLASDLRNSTSSVRFRRLSFNPTKEKRQWRLTIAVRFFGAGDGNRTRVTSLGSLFLTRPSATRINRLTSLFLKPIL